MKVLIAGGVFRLDPAEIERRAPTPESNLAKGLVQQGIEVVTSPLEDLATLARPRGFDLVHVHHLSKGALVSALSPWVPRMVFTVHAGSPPPTRSRRNALRAIFAGMDAGVCLSKAEQDVWSTFRPRSAERLHVVPNGVPDLSLPPKLRTRPEARPLKLLYVGQLIHLKRVDRAIRAVAAVPETELSLVFHNDELASELLSLSRSLGVEDRVKFLGQRVGRSLAEVYLSSHALVLPSETEALPTVITEALQSGLPVLASNVGGIEEQVGSSGILFSGRDDEALTLAVRQLAHGYDDFAVRAFDRTATVIERFSLDQMARSHVRIYESVLEA